MTRAEIVQAGKLGIVLGRGEEGVPLLLRPFAVHQLVDGMAGGPPSAKEQPHCDSEAEDRVGKPPTEELIEHQRDDHRPVEHQVRFVVDVVSLDRD